MRFALDLVWLERSGNVVAIDERVPPSGSGPSGGPPS
jgi:uncharacterized membrane protein (UPF0127 family)